MKKILLLSFLISFTSQIFKAQSLFGWNVSLDYNSLNTKINIDSIKSVAQKFAIDKSGGFSLGIPLNIKLANLIMLRPQFVFNVSMGQLDYTLPDGTSKSTKFPSINVEVPIQAVISNFSKFHGLALILGLKGGYKLADLSKNQAELFSKSYGTFDTGLGYRIKIGKKTSAGDVDPFAALIAKILTGIIVKPEAFKTINMICAFVATSGFGFKV